MAVVACDCTRPVLTGAVAVEEGGVHKRLLLRSSRGIPLLALLVGDGAGTLLTDEAAATKGDDDILVQLDAAKRAWLAPPIRPVVKNKLLMEDDVFSVGVASTPGGSVVELLCERPELSKKLSDSSDNVVVKNKLLMEDDVFSVGVASTPGGSVVELLCERPELSKKLSDSSDNVVDSFAASAVVVDGCGC